MFVVPHPIDTDPRVLAAQSLIARIRSAQSSHEWRALQQDLDSWKSPLQLCSALAFACDVRAREALADELRRSCVVVMEE